MPAGGRQQAECAGRGRACAALDPDEIVSAVSPDHSPAHPRPVDLPVMTDTSSPGRAPRTMPAGRRTRPATPAVLAQLPPPRMRSTGKDLRIVPPDRAYLLGHCGPAVGLVLDRARPHALQLRRLPAGAGHFGSVVPPLLPQLVMTRPGQHPRQPQLLTGAELQQPHAGRGLRRRLASLCLQLLSYGPTRPARRQGQRN